VPKDDTGVSRRLHEGERRRRALLENLVGGGRLSFRGIGEVQGLGREGRSFGKKMGKTALSKHPSRISGAKRKRKEMKNKMQQRIKTKAKKAVRQRTVASDKVGGHIGCLTATWKRQVTEFKAQS